MNKFLFKCSSNIYAIVECSCPTTFFQNNSLPLQLLLKSIVHVIYSATKSIQSSQWRYSMLTYVFGNICEDLVDIRFAWNIVLRLSFCPCHVCESGRYWPTELLLALLSDIKIAAPHHRHTNWRTEVQEHIQK